jgi:hypothetical protein
MKNSEDEGNKRNGIAVFLIVWPWLPLMFAYTGPFVLMIILFLMIMFPGGAISAAVGVIVARKYLQDHPLRLYAVMSGYVGMVVWFTLTFGVDLGWVGKMTLM